MNSRRLNRCPICHAIIPHDKELCPICEAYHPCRECHNKAKAQCMCRKWKTWFSLQWAKFHPKDS